MTRVAVPQDDGEITVSRNGDEPVTYKVKDGTVTVTDDVAAFLNAVEGSRLEAKPVSATKEK